MSQTSVNAPFAPPHYRATLLNIFLQCSHRLGAIALLATLGAWAMMYNIRDFHVPLALAAGFAEAGLCCGLLAHMMTRVGQPSRREANGVSIFNLVLLVLAIQLMLFARLDVIRAAAGDFFTPSPQVDPHG
jgi:predicted PurR-regulated permease PerM